LLQYGTCLRVPYRHLGGHTPVIGRSTGEWSTAFLDDNEKPEISILINVLIFYILSVIFTVFNIAFSAKFPKQKDRL
jgi:hypothetical protein